jgi:hypothetical protein
MANVNMPRQTRSDKAHQKYIDKLNTYKEGMVNGINSITSIHKHSLDSCNEFVEKYSKSQESERNKCMAILEKSDDENKCQWAMSRLNELDQIKQEEFNNYYKFAANENDKSYKEIRGHLFLLLGVCGFAAGSTRKVQQIAKKTIAQISANK